MTTSRKSSKKSTSDLRLLIPRVSYSFNNPDPYGPALVEPLQIDNSAEIAGHKVGQEITYQVSAPGCGRVTYRVARIDERGLWARLISSSVRELTLADVI